MLSDYVRRNGRETRTHLRVDVQSGARRLQRRELALVLGEVARGRLKTREPVVEHRQVQADQRVLPAVAMQASGTHEKNDLLRNAQRSKWELLCNCNIYVL